MKKASASAFDFVSEDENSSVIHRLPALCKAAIVFTSVACIVSFGRYELAPVLASVIIPLLLYTLSGISLAGCFSKFKAVIPLVVAVGIFNPFFDKKIILTLGTLEISGGVVSMLTLIIKGLECVALAFLLAKTTSPESLCAGLRRLHVPKNAVTMVLLTVRYIPVLVGELRTMTDAYRLRAPGQKGVAFSAWGSFLGQLVLRSHDRAQELYNAMLLRGYDGNFPETAKQSGKAEIVSSIVAVIVLVSLRILCNFIF